MLSLIQNLALQLHILLTNFNHYKLVCNKNEKAYVFNLQSKSSCVIIIISVIRLQSLVSSYLTLRSEACFLQPGPDTLNSASVFWMNSGVAADTLVLLHQSVIHQTWKSQKQLSLISSCKEETFSLSISMRNSFLHTCSKAVLYWWLLDYNGEGGGVWRGPSSGQRAVHSHTDR